MIALLAVDRDMPVAGDMNSASGNSASGHLVSCRHSTSGRRSARKRATRSMRRRTELMFQVATVKRKGQPDGSESGPRRLGFARAEASRGGVLPTGACRRARPGRRQCFCPIIRCSRRSTNSFSSGFASSGRGWTASPRSGGPARRRPSTVSARRSRDRTRVRSAPSRRASPCPRS